jgi:hypothetical protein
MTAMLVGTPEDVGGHPGVTATIPRDEIEEALASDEPLDLILDVTWPKDGGVETTDVTVHWQRSDLESLLAGTGSDAITFSFDRAALEQAIDEPDFEGQGIREVMLLTVAAASASAAVAVSTAQGMPVDVGGGGGPTPVVVAPGHGEAGTAQALAGASVVAPGHDEATTARDLAAPAAIHDEATLAARGVDVPIATSIAAHDEASTARDLAAPAAIHDEATLAARGVGQPVPGMDEASLAARGIETAAPSAHDEATLAARGIDVPIATAIAGHDEASTARDLAAPAAIHDEATLAARGVGVTVPGMDESTLAARGIEPQPLPASHDEATLAARGIEAPVAADSGSSFELPSVDGGTAAAIGGLAGAGLLIAAAAFAARRNRVGTA